MSCRAVLAAAVLLLTTPATAAGPLYRATLATPPATAATVVKELRWQCSGAVCEAPFTATASDGNMCAAVARVLGPVTGFGAGARTFDPAELERCNRKTR